MVTREGPVKEENTVCGGNRSTFGHYVHWESKSLKYTKLVYKVEGAVEGSLKTCWRCMSLRAQNLVKIYDHGSDTSDLVSSFAKILDGFANWKLLF